MWLVLNGKSGFLFFNKGKHTFVLTVVSFVKTKTQSKAKKQTNNPTSAENDLVEIGFHWALHLWLPEMILPVLVMTATVTVFVLGDTCFAFFFLFSFCHGSASLAFLLFFSAIIPYCNSQSRRSLFFEGVKETFIRNVCLWVMHWWSFSYPRDGIELVHQHASTPSIKVWMAGSTLKMNLKCSTAWQVFLELVSFWKDSFFLFESYKTYAVLHHLIIYCIYLQ